MLQVAYLVAAKAAILLRRMPAAGVGPAFDSPRVAF
jgi:hypothetical protein